jgi:hypothetical protein
VISTLSTDQADPEPAISALSTDHADQACCCFGSGCARAPYPGSHDSANLLFLKEVVILFPF